MAETAEETGTAPRAWIYPALDAAEIAALNAKLAEVVALRHQGRLTAAQHADLVAAIETQTRHAEALHRVPLQNADEPAFVRAPLGDGR
ncbi:hypothetical protein ACELLULO517_20170 [Acidisoma cellulosilytica]|uniref:Uncharacterized protein n=1 Tax=Acidisoma cellulosilyticum TaxID=2802395 RepID=A0A964E623_9PROT|nr:hypothetical protein [Acidisoma cellulosilyticum]MCB8882573.1 hypothetical protein [Acidisoma cellulosilyticum]